jgi:hypothetical protein
MFPPGKALNKESLTIFITSLPLPETIRLPSLALAIDGSDSITNDIKNAKIIDFMLHLT